MGPTARGRTTIAGASSWSRANRSGISIRTKRVVFGKSLTGPSMHCAVVDRLHDPDCPDVFVLATGDKDITIVLDYIYEHGKKASGLARPIPFPAT